MNIDVIIIIPAYNESHLVTVLDDVFTNTPYRVLLVDDGSEISYDLSKYENRLLVTRHDINLGQGAALQTGFEIARLLNPRYVITMDADGQHDISSIFTLVNEIESKNVDVVFGKRDFQDKTSNISKLRMMILKIGILFNWLYTGIKLSDAHNGYRILSKKAYSTLNLNESEMAHATEILEEVAKHKLSYSECTVRVHYSEYSKEKGQKNSNLVSIVKNLIFRRL